MGTRTVDSELNVPLWAWGFRRLVHGVPYFPGKARIVNRIGGLIRGNGYEVVAPCRLGGRLRLPIDDWVPSQIFFYGWYEYIETNFFASLLRPGMVVLDVGAHIGYYTVLAAMKIFSSGVVHAFEPTEETFRRLTENIALNELQNVKANRCAVCERSEEGKFFIGDATNLGSSSLRAPSNFSGQVEKVQMVAIDDYVEEHGIQRVDLVKLDIQGAEHSAILGMSRLLHREPAMQLLVEVDEELLGQHDTSSSALLRTLRELGYNPFKIRKRGVTPIRGTQIADEALILFRR